jgi:phosphoglycolate phosphatase
MLEHVRSTMGESKITVFRHLLHDDALAERANVAFEAAYGSEIEAGRIAPIDGAETTMAELRAAGIRVALTTGFSPATQRALIHALGWEDVVDLALAPADAGRGRPYPDLPLTALLRLQIDDVRAMAVVGDTRADIQSGRRAGASVVAGVLNRRARS